MVALVGVLLEADVDVLYGGRAVSGLDGVEGVQAADDDARLADVTSTTWESCRIGRSATSLPSSTRTAVTSMVTPASRRAVRPAPISKPSRPPRRRVLEAVVRDHPRHGVHDRLGEPLGALDAVDLRDAVLAERAAQLVGQVVAAHDHRGGLAAELLGQLRALGDRAERVLVELALVVNA